MAELAKVIGCAVCHTGLDVYQYPDKPTEYKHSDTTIRQYGSIVTDHEPQPVQLDQLDMIGVCDFCGAKHPRFTYPCETFTISEAIPTDVGMGMIADWAACYICHALIEHDEWDILARRSADQAPAEMHIAVQLAVRYLHQQFRAHRTGPAVDSLAPSGPSRPAGGPASPSPS